MIFAGAFLGGAIAHRLRQPVIIGYVLAGLALSPFTPGPSVHDVHSFEMMAEVGVILLMFSVGVEFSVPDLLSVKWVALLGAPLGIGLFAALGMGVAWILRWPPTQGLAIGFMICVASTMVVLRLLMERGELLTPSGRVMMGITLMEDLAGAFFIRTFEAAGGRLGNRQSIPDSCAHPSRGVEGCPEAAGAHQPNWKHGTHALVRSDGLPRDGGRHRSRGAFAGPWRVSGRPAGRKLGAGSHHGAKHAVLARRVRGALFRHGGFADQSSSPGAGLALAAAHGGAGSRGQIRHLGERGAAVPLFLGNVLAHGDGPDANRRVFVHSGADLPASGADHAGTLQRGSRGIPRDDPRQRGVVSRVRRSGRQGNFIERCAGGERKLAPRRGESCASASGQAREVHRGFMGMVVANPAYGSVMKQ